MKSPRAATRILTGVACILISPTVRSAPTPDPGADGKVAQPSASGTFTSLADLEAHYARQSAELERKKLADLGALAERQTGPDAEVTYRAALDLAVARGLFSEAEPIARAYLAHNRGEHEN